MKKRKYKRKPIDLPKLLEAVKENGEYQYNYGKNKQFTLKQVTEIIEAYQTISHDELAYNLRKVMGYPYIKKQHQNNWMRKISGENTETVKSWLSAKKYSKTPFKYVASVAQKLNVSIYDLLTPPPKGAVNSIKEDEYIKFSYSDAVIKYSQEHPEKSVQEIANDLGIASLTVRRHLKNYRKEQNNV